MKVKRISSFTWIFGGIFAVFGIAAIVVGICLFMDDMEFQENAVTTNAVITDIESRRYKSGKKYRTSHTVYIEYVVDGETYNSTLGHYNSAMRVGKSVEIMYNPENPEDCRGDTSVMELVIISAIGSVFTLIGVLIIVSFSRKSMGRITVKKNGQRMEGIITNVVEDTGVRVNGQCGCRAEVEVMDAATGCKYLFSSETVMNSIDEVSSYIGGSVDVYVNPVDKNRNYVDLGSARLPLNSGAQVFDFR